MKNLFERLNFYFNGGAVKPPTAPELALQMTEDYASFMECSKQLSEIMAKHKADIDAAALRVHAITTKPTPGA